MNPFLVYSSGDTCVAGVFSTLEKAVQYIKNQVEKGYHPEDYFIYNPPMDVPYDIGVDEKYLVDYKF